MNLHVPITPARANPRHYVISSVTRACLFFQSCTEDFDALSCFRYMNIVQDIILLQTKGYVIERHEQSHLI